MDLRNTNLNLLRYFYDAARTGSLTLSAQINHVSRPAISQAIARLEGSLGVVLTKHTKRQLILTDKGHLVSKHCELIFSNIDNLGVEIAKSEGGYHGNLSVALSQSLCEPFIFPLIKKVQKKHSRLVFQLRFATTPGIKQLVEENICQVGITLDDGSLGYFSKEIIERGHFIFVGHHKGQIKDGIICTEERAEIQKLRGEFHKKFKSPLSVKMKVDSWGISLRLAEEGFGLAFVPEFLLAAKKNDKLRKIELGLPKIPYTVVSIRHPNMIEHPGPRLIFENLGINH